VGGQEAQEAKEVFRAAAAEREEREAEPESIEREEAEERREEDAREHLCTGGGCEQGGGEVRNGREGGRCTTARREEGARGGARTSGTCGQMSARPRRWAASPTSSHSSSVRQRVHARCAERGICAAATYENVRQPNSRWTKEARRRRMKKRRPCTMSSRILMSDRAFGDAWIR